MVYNKHIDILEKGVETWNKWRQDHGSVTPELEDAVFVQEDFCKANLSSGRLYNAHFSSCKFGRADLSRADLSNAFLSDTDFSRASLVGADLGNVNLFNANLSHADLSRANLIGANLSRVQLKRTNFSGARFVETILADVDLTEAIGLDTCRHQGHCTVDYRTLAKSKDVPLAFWHGCGLPDSLIDYMPSLLNQVIQFYSCFISYSHEDKSFAKRLHDQLQAQGIRCWLDDHQILPGDNIAKEIDTGIRLWDKVLLCCSEHSLKRPWVNREMEKALQKEERLWNERGCEILALIPINLDGALFEWDGHWKSEIVKRHAPDFTGWEQDNAKFEAQFERVLKALRADDAARERPPIPKL